MTAVLSTNELTVAPGDQTTCTVQVRNTGSVVDEYTFEVVGQASSWATIDPPRLTLYPGTEGTATVRFAPPRLTEVSAGQVPFGIRVASREDPTSTSVEEGVLNVQPFVDAFAELVPRTAHGRMRATYELAVDNRGNRRINAPLSTFDPDNVLQFRLEPPTLVVEPGTAAFAKVRVRPRNMFWRGHPQTKTFQVSAQPDGLPPLVADGALLQESLLPDWLPRAAMAALGVLALLLVVWLVALKPNIQGFVKKKVNQGLQKPAPETQAVIQKAADAAVDKRLNPLEKNGQIQLTLNTGLKGDPYAKRLTTTGSGIASDVVPDNEVLQITDIVLENPPSDDRGTLTIQRDGIVLMSVALENFRDLDYHFVAPIVFKARDKLEMVVNVTSCNGICQPAIYYSGYMASA